MAKLVVVTAIHPTPRDSSGLTASNPATACSPSSITGLDPNGVPRLVYSVPRNLTRHPPPPLPLTFQVSPTLSALKDLALPAGTVTLLGEGECGVWHGQNI